MYTTMALPRRHEMLWAGDDTTRSAKKGPSESELIHSGNSQFQFPVLRQQGTRKVTPQRPKGRESSPLLNN